MLLTNTSGTFALTEHIFRPNGDYIGNISCNITSKEAQPSLFTVDETRQYSPSLTASPIAKLGTRLEYNAEIDRWITHYRGHHVTGSSTRYGDKVLMTSGMVLHAGLNFSGFTVKFPDQHQVMVRYVYIVSELIAVTCATEQTSLSLNDSTIRDEHQPHDVSNEWYGQRHVFEPLTAALATQVSVRRHYITPQKWEDRVISSATEIKSISEVISSSGVERYQESVLFTSDDKLIGKHEGLIRRYGWLSEIRIHDGETYGQTFILLDAKRRQMVEIQQGWSDHPEYIGPTELYCTILQAT